MPVQNNTNDCGVFVLIFLYHLLLMDGVNNFEQMDDSLCALKKHKLIYCDSSNMCNLREFVLKTILEACTITQVSQLMLEKSEWFFSHFNKQFLHIFRTSNNLTCSWNTIPFDLIDNISNIWPHSRQWRRRNDFVATYIELNCIMFMNL